MRILYRSRQFWGALSATPDELSLTAANQVLSAPLMNLFLKMQPSEQAHSLRIYMQLHSSGEQNHDLLVAALLHDVGKSLYPLRSWERALVVLVKAFYPPLAKRWGQGQPIGWRRAFVVAENHPAWGADLALQSGASPLVAAIIRRHQERSDARLKGDEESLTGDDQESDLLNRLQNLDDEN